MSGDLTFDRFVEGWNTRDDRSALRTSEAVQALNVTISQTGAIKKRPGCSSFTTIPSLPAGDPSFLNYSAALNLFFVQVDSQLYSCPPGGGSWTSRGAAFGSTARIAMCDFGAQVVYCHPTSGVFTFDGTTVTNRSATVRGNAIAAWQTYVWVAGDPTSADTRSRLYRCKVNDPTVWGSPDGITVDLREKDTELLTALHGGSALVVFKSRSHYRVNDSATGAFTTVDWTAGCVNPTALDALDGIIYAWGEDGIYACDGMSPGRNVTDQIRDEFALSATNRSGYVHAARNKRTIYFTYPSPVSVNSIAGLELYPTLRRQDGGLAVIPHFLGAGLDYLDPVAYTRYLNSIVFVTSDSKRRTLFDSAQSIDDVVYTSSWLTGRFQGPRSRLRHATVLGTWYSDNGSLSISFTADDGNGDATQQVSLNTNTGQRFSSLGQGYAFQFLIGDIGDNTTPYHAWSLTELACEFDPLERSSNRRGRLAPAIGAGRGAHRDHGPPAN